MRHWSMAHSSYSLSNFESRFEHQGNKTLWAVRLSETPDDFSRVIYLSFRGRYKNFRMGSDIKVTVPHERWSTCIQTSDKSLFSMSRTKYLPFNTPKFSTWSFIILAPSHYPTSERITILIPCLCDSFFLSRCNVSFTFLLCQNYFLCKFPLGKTTPRLNQKTRVIYLEKMTQDKSVLLKKCKTIGIITIDWLTPNATHRCDPRFHRQRHSSHLHTLCAAILLRSNIPQLCHIWLTDPRNHNRTRHRSRNSNRSQCQSRRRWQIRFYHKDKWRKCSWQRKRWEWKDLESTKCRSERAKVEFVVDIVTRIITMLFYPCRWCFRFRWWSGICRRSWSCFSNDAPTCKWSWKVSV